MSGRRYSGVKSGRADRVEDATATRERLASMAEITARMRVRNDALATHLREPLPRPALTSSELPAAIKTLTDARALRTGAAVPPDSGVQLTRQESAGFATAFGAESATERRALIAACEELEERATGGSPLATAAREAARALREALTTPDSVRKMRAAVTRLDALQRKE